MAVGYLKTAINSSSKFICQIEHCLFNMTGCKRSYNVAHVARYRCLLWRVATCRQSVLPVPVPGCWGRRSAGEGVCNHIKIARLKAHRVAADSKRLSRQLLEYPVNHIIIEGVFWRAVSEATAACGRVFTSASLAPFSCHLLPATATAATHVAVVVVANMLSSCCMRRFLSLISIAIAIVARVSAIRSQLLTLPQLLLLLRLLARVAACSLHRLRCHKSLANMLFITRPPVPATRCGSCLIIMWKPS